MSDNNGSGEFRTYVYAGRYHRVPCAHYALHYSAPVDWRISTLTNEVRTRALELRSSEFPQKKRAIFMLSEAIKTLMPTLGTRIDLHHSKARHAFQNEYLERPGTDVAKLFDVIHLRLRKVQTRKTQRLMSLISGIANQNFMGAVS